MLTATVVSLVFGATPAGATAFTNSTAITTTDPPCDGSVGPATLYPSNINVTGMTGTVSDVNVTLSGMNNWRGDFEILLASPGGSRNLVLLSDAGTGDVTNFTLTFDDSAAAVLPQSGSWGASPLTARPTNYTELSGAESSFPSPAPSPLSNPAPAGAATLASVFNGAAPNGNWSLYVVGDACDDPVETITGGWTIDLATTAGAPTTTAVGSSLNPSNTGQNVTFTATVTSGGSAVTTGTVTFSEGVTVLAAGVALNGSGQASFSKSNLTEGNHVITATYNGVAAFAASSGSVNQRVDNVTTVTGNQYCNTGAVTINATPTAATPYPSNIFVTGASTLTKVTATLKNVTHTFPDDIDALLVGPAGQNLVLLSDAGNPGGPSGSGATNVTAVFDDAAPTQLAQSVPWGAPGSTVSTKPVDYDPAAQVDSFLSPAPAPSAATALSTFNGTNPNGTWSLYVVSDGAPDTGTIAGGWCITLTLAPPAPTGLVATATSQSRIALTWNAVSGATSYEVYRSTTSGVFGGAPKVVTTNSYDNTGLSPNTTYYYVVRTVSASGTSANSSQAQATTPAAPTPPASVTASAVGATRVNVSWSAVGGISSYEVYHSTVSGSSYTKVGTVSATSFVHTSAAPGTTNYYVVRSRTATGTSANSPQASALTPALPVPPTGVSAVALTSTHVQVSWNSVAGATAYEVYRATNSGGPYTKIKTVSVTSVIDTAALPSTGYFYVVRTVSPTGTSANSTPPAAVTTPA